MPIHVVCPECQADYDLKDDFAGAQVRCRHCKSVIEVPDAEPVVAVTRSRAYDEELHPAFQRDKFLLRQKHLALSAKYYVYDEDGEKIMFIERPVYWGRSLAAIFLGILAMLVVTIGTIVVGAGLIGAGGVGGVLGPIIIVAGMILGLVAMLVIILKMAPKRHITFYSDDSREEPLLEVLQDYKVMLINATYTVRDAEGRRLGRFRKNYLYNFFRKRWYGYDADGNEVLVAMEDSLILSLLRRFIGPLFGILRTNFIICKPDGDTLIGEFNRKFTLLDRYVLDMSHDEEGYLDRRLAVALGVLLDTGEHR